MAESTSIEWCDATFNPWWGCQKVSPACDHCYAERDSKRFAPGRVLWGVGSERRTFGEGHWNEPLRWARTMPAKLGRRPRVFCASMGDFSPAQGARRSAAAQVLSLIAEKPERAVWWVRMEGLGLASKADGALFRNDRPSYSQMLKFSSEQRDMFDNDEEALACFCGE